MFSGIHISNGKLSHVSSYSCYLLFVGNLFLKLYLYNFSTKLIIYIFLPPRQYFFTAQAQCFITFKRHMNSLSPIVNEPSGEIHLTWV